MICHVDGGSGRPSLHQFILPRVIALCMHQLPACGIVPVAFVHKVAYGLIASTIPTEFDYSNTMIVCDWTNSIVNGQLLQQPGTSANSADTSKNKRRPLYMPLIRSLAPPPGRIYMENAQTALQLDSSSKTVPTTKSLVNKLLQCTCLQMIRYRDLIRTFSSSLKERSATV